MATAYLILFCSDAHHSVAPMVVARGTDLESMLTRFHEKFVNDRSSDQMDAADRAAIVHEADQILTAMDAAEVYSIPHEGSYHLVEA